MAHGATRKEILRVGALIVVGFVLIEVVWRPPYVWRLDAQHLFMLNASLPLQRASPLNGCDSDPLARVPGTIFRSGVSVRGRGAGGVPGPGAQAVLRDRARANASCGVDPGWGMFLRRRFDRRELGIFRSHGERNDSVSHPCSRGDLRRCDAWEAPASGLVCAGPACAVWNVADGRFATRFPWSTSTGVEPIGRGADSIRSGAAQGTPCEHDFRRWRAEPLLREITDLF